MAKLVPPAFQEDAGILATSKAGWTKMTRTSQCWTTSLPRARATFRVCYVAAVADAPGPRAMRYLLDTNILSEVIKKRPSASVRSALDVTLEVLRCRVEVRGHPGSTPCGPGSGPLSPS